MITYHHEPTNTRVETQTGTVSGETPWVKMQLSTQYVNTSVTVYDSRFVGKWSCQSVHLQAGNDDTYAEIVNRDEREPYLVVRLNEHDRIFVPMAIAEAITAAIITEEAAA